MKTIDVDEYLEEYVKTLPRPEIKFFDDHIESYIWEVIKKPNMLTGIKKVEVSVPISDISNFIAEISYASEKYGENQFRQKCLTVLTSIMGDE